jgi:hypothetical protein
LPASGEIEHTGNANKNSGDFMPLNLRRAVVRNGLITGLLCLVLSLGLSLFTGGMQFNLANLGWPILLALGIGAFTSWQVSANIKRGVLKSLPKEFSYVALRYGEPVNGIAIDWDTIDDYAIQLMARGYTRLGEFTTMPLSPHFVGVAACFADRTATTMVEVQYIQMNKGVSANLPNVGGVHFSISSLLGGVITATTTDHKIAASNYLIRGSNSAVASYPGLGLLPLLEKHTRLVARLVERSGKRPTSGLGMNHSVLLQRERFAQARARVEAMSGYEIARQIDAFEAEPRTNWATSSSRLAKLADRPLSALESSEYARGRAAILNLDGTPFRGNAAAQETNAGTVSTGDVDGVTVMAHSSDSATAEQVTAADMQAEDPRAEELRKQIDSGASWFYWIAGLSLVNAIIAAAGSPWSFIIGLGIPQVMTAIASGMPGDAASTVIIAILWIVSFAIAGFFAACGWFAKRPSVAAFIAGMVLFGLDTLIFVYAEDWIGVAFHALALYFFWKGLSAAREYKKLA